MMPEDVNELTLLRSFVRSLGLLYLGLRGLGGGFIIETPSKWDSICIVG